VLLASILAGNACAVAATDQSLVERVQRYEVIVFGHTRPGTSIFDRIRAIESVIWGKPQHGNVIQTLDRIENALHAFPESEDKESSNGDRSQTESTSSNEDHDRGASASTPSSEIPATSGPGYVQDMLREAAAKYAAGDVASAKNLFTQAL